MREQDLKIALVEDGFGTWTLDLATSAFPDIAAMIDSGARLSFVFG